MTAPEDLMLQELRYRYRDCDVQEVFLRLYSETDSNSRMFAYFHQHLNSLFNFLNTKSKSNGHFNAHESRQLLALIEEIHDAQELLNRVGSGFTVVDNYQRTLDECTTFLAETNGSEIPATFQRVVVVKYDRVFISSDNEIRLRERLALADLKMVASGAFANVYRFIDPEYGIPIAIKRAKNNLGPRDLERFRKEFDLMKGLNFPYVLQVYKYNADKHEYSMEYCDSTLRDYIDENNARLSFDRRKRIALQFLYGMNYLHSKLHLHRDISYQNVLIKKYDGNAVIVKLSDFGLTKEHDSDFTKTESELRGTIVDPTIKSFKEYSLVNEIYAVGFLLSFIFSGRKDIGACDGPVRSIIDKCVAYDHSGRYSDVLSIIGDVDVLETPTPGN